MPKKETIKIQEVSNVFDDRLLDIIGNAFKFDHVKGLAEWLKNSIDAYARIKAPHSNQYVIFRFTDKESQLPTFECIDFVGMGAIDIEKAFKRWGDPEAARRGERVKVYGGHGNGGKFYMRQMFKKSHFITYKAGKLNIFGFSENRKYGFASGYEDKEMDPTEAIKLANINKLPIPKEIKNKMLDKKTGFTVVKGIGPNGIKNKINIVKEIERIKHHPQSRRILLRSNVSVVYNDESLYGLLRPEELEPLEKFPEPRAIEVPESLPLKTRGETSSVVLSNQKYEPGKLILRTSKEAMMKGSKMGELNRIDIIGELGTVGSYPLYEIGVMGFPQAAFIYGECVVPILEDSENDCVSNDRSRLVVNDTTTALIHWIAEEVDKLASEISETEREQQKETQKEITSRFNDILNQWKNKHMKRIFADILGGNQNGGGGGGGGGKIGKLTAPPNGFDFRFTAAKIPVEISSPLTLKVSIPKPIPIGTIIFAESSNELVELSGDKFSVKAENIKITDEGQDVGIINIHATGLRIGEKATITASAGKHKSSIDIEVVEGGGSEGPKHPKVLLSNHDSDPLEIAPGGKVILGERDPVVYQRPQDVKQGIYWINTSSPMAAGVYEKFSFDSLQWRNFLFQRYIDVFVKELVYELYRKDYENFSAERVDVEISELIRSIHANAKEDLESFLFDEGFVANE